MKAMTKYPKIKPMHVCIYVMSIVITIPGTDTNVMPDMEAPTIPNATIYQGDFLLPRKNVSLLVLRPVIMRLNRYNAAKYTNIVNTIVIQCCAY